MKDWKSTIKPIKQAVIRPHWKNTIRPEIKPAKDFIFEEHETRIYKFIKRYLDSIRDSLKLKFSDLTEAEKKSLKGAKGDKGDSIKGDKGQDAQRWFVFEKIDNEVGKEGDLALHTKTYEILEKHDGKWIAISAFKLPKAQQTMVTGGVSAQFVADYVAQNGGGGGGGSSFTWNAVETYIDLTISDQDFLVLKGTSALTITLLDQPTKPIRIRNMSAESAEIIIEGSGSFAVDVDGLGNILTDTSFIIPRLNEFSFTKLSDGYYYAY